MKICPPLEVQTLVLKVLEALFALSCYTKVTDSHCLAPLAKIVGNMH